MTALLLPLQHICSVCDEENVTLFLYNFKL